MISFIGFIFFGTYLIRHKPGVVMSHLHTEQTLPYFFLGSFSHPCGKIDVNTLGVLKRL